jgi:hypothetical protein
LVMAWKVKIRPVRTISRKDPVPLTGWIGSHATWVTGWPDSSMVREASMSPSVESVTVDFHGHSTCPVRPAACCLGNRTSPHLEGSDEPGGKRRRSDEEIIATLRNWESSEAICRAPSLKQRDEDMVHTSWRHGD